MKLSMLTTLLFISLVSILGLTQSHAQRRQAVVKEDLSGVWVGDYQCEDKHHPLLLEITEGRRGQVQAVFHGIYDNQEYLKFELTGMAQEHQTPEKKSRRRSRRGHEKTKLQLSLSLKPKRWVERPSQDFIMVSLNGKVRGNLLRGRIKAAGCGNFEVEHLACDFSEDAPCTRKDRGSFARILNRFGAKKRHDRHARRADRREQRRRSRRENRHDHHDDHHDDHHHDQDNKPVEPKIIAMSNEQFSDLIAKLTEVGFDPKRLEILQLVMSSNHLSSQQARQILDLFTFDPKKLEAITLFKGRLVDPNGSFLLLETFTFDRHKKQAALLLAGQGTLEETEATKTQEETKKPQAPEAQKKPEVKEVKVEMEQVLFAQLLSQVDDVSFDKERLSIIKLSSQGTWFSPTQVKSLLEKWTFDPDRIDALRVLAPRLTEYKTTFNLLTVFTFDSNRKQAAEILTTAANNNR